MPTDPEQLVLGILVSLDHDYIGTWERPWRTPDVVASVVSLKTRGPLPCLSRHSLTLFAMFIDNESPLVFYQGNWASYSSVDLGMLGTVNGTMSAALDLDASASVFFLGTWVAVHGAVTAMVSSDGTQAGVYAFEITVDDKQDTVYHAIRPNVDRTSLLFNSSLLSDGFHSVTLSIGNNPNAVFLLDAFETSEDAILVKPSSSAFASVTPNSSSSSSTHSMPISSPMTMSSFEPSPARIGSASSSTSTYISSASPISLPIQRSGSSITSNASAIGSPSIMSTSFSTSFPTSSCAISASCLTTSSSSLRDPQQTAQDSQHKATSKGLVVLAPAVGGSLLVLSFAIGAYWFFWRRRQAKATKYRTIVEKHDESSASEASEEVSQFPDGASEPRRLTSLRDYSHPPDQAQDRRSHDHSSVASTAENSSTPRPRRDTIVGPTDPSTMPPPRKSVDAGISLAGGPPGNSEVVAERAYRWSSLVENDTIGPTRPPSYTDLASR